MKLRHLQTLFTESTWIVPTRTLRAYLTIGNTPPEEVIDQTVWILDKFEKGYVFGTSYTMIDGTPLSKTRIVGSITPDGNVLFSFHTNTTITSGQGAFQIRSKCHSDRKSCRFLMQMNTLNSLDQGVLGISHWSYMVPTNPLEYEYHNLPGVGLSVPEFIAMFDTTN